MPTCSPTARVTGRHPLWTTPSATKRPRCCGATSRRNSLAERGEVVLCVDEKPNIQVLRGQQPMRSMRPGLIERREFEYKRHGTVNLLAKLVVHSGRMRSWDLESNDGACLRAVLPQLLEDHHEARRIHLIWDNGPSHKAKADARLPTQLLPSRPGAVYAASCLLAQPGGTAATRLHRSLPAARGMGQPGRTHRPLRRKLARVQPPLRPPLHLVLDSRQDARVGGPAPVLTMLKNLSDTPLVLLCHKVEGLPTPEEAPGHVGTSNHA